MRTAAHVAEAPFLPALVRRERARYGMVRDPQLGARPDTLRAFGTAVLHVEGILLRRLAGRVGTDFYRVFFLRTVVGSGMFCR
jgi:hypothetical protein